MINSTERLILRNFDINDAAQLFELNANPKVLQFTGDKVFSDVNEAQNFIKAYDHYKKFGFGRWAVIRKKDHAFLGWCGLKQHDTYVDLGFRLKETYWNKGYATEAAQACIEYAFNHLQLTELICRVSKDNKASIRVIEKLGMNFFKYDECEGISDAAYYQLKAKDWQAKP